MQLMSLKQQCQFHLDGVSNLYLRKQTDNFSVDDTYRWNSHLDLHPRVMTSNMPVLTRSILLMICTVPMVLAQTRSTMPSSPSSTDARAASSIIPSTSSFAYVGCYNETTGNPELGSVRALTGGNMVRLGTAATYIIIIFLIPKADPLLF